MKINLLISLKILTLLFIVSFKKNLESVPPDYCLQRLNDSDCKVTPMQVFSYFKPGSRCELEVWKGCPTLNKFYTQRDCVEVCIKRARQFKNSPLTGHGDANAFCTKPLNLYNCNSNFSFAFVFDQKTNECVEIVWTGCPHSGNIFQKKKDCVEKCGKGVIKWKQKMYNLTLKESDQIDSILKAILLNSDDVQEIKPPREIRSTKKSKRKTESSSSTQLKLVFKVTTEEKQTESTVIFDDEINKNITNDNLIKSDEAKNSQQPVTDEVASLTSKFISIDNAVTATITTQKKEIKKAEYEPNIDSYDTSVIASTDFQVTRENTMTTEKTIRTIATTLTSKTQKPSTGSTIDASTTNKMGTAKEVVLPDDY